MGAENYAGILISRIQARFSKLSKLLDKTLINMNDEIGHWHVSCIKTKTTLFFLKSII